MDPERVRVERVDDAGCYFFDRRVGDVDPGRLHLLFHLVIGDVRRLPGSLFRELVRSRAPRLEQSGPQHVRPGEQDRGADLVRRVLQLAVETLRQRDDAGFGYGVLRRARQWRDAAVARRRVDDVALLALREDRRHEGVDAVDDAPQVDGEGPPPVVQLVFPDRTLRAGADARVVADDVHRAVRLQSCLTQRLNRLELRDVGGHTGDLESLLAKLVHGLRQQVGLDVGQHDAHAFLREALTERTSEATGATRDDRNT